MISGESARLPPMWFLFTSGSVPQVVEFVVGSCLAPRFFYVFSVFPTSINTDTPDFFLSTLKFSVSSFIRGGLDSNFIVNFLQKLEVKLELICRHFIFTEFRIFCLWVALTLKRTNL